ncbi:MAG: alpha/beta hydrolase [Steroidobacteraceae bacterium]
MTYQQRESDDAIVLQLASGAAASSSVIWLHGLGADGYDFVPIVPELRLPEQCAPRFIFPHAPIRAVTVNNGMRMRAWYDILDFSPGAAEDAAGISASAAIADRYIAREREAGIAANRIVLAGFSQGGAIALHAGLRQTEPLAGILALSTYLPLRAMLSEAPMACREVPILMCHGQADPILPMALGEASRDLLRRTGCRVEWKEYPMQHQVCAAEIADISTWLFRVLGTAGADPKPGPA